MALLYWLKPDYWRLLIQSLHQYHPLHPIPLIHHPLYHLGASFAWRWSSPPPPGAMPPPLDVDELTQSFLTWLLFSVLEFFALEGPD